MFKTMVWVGVFVGSLVGSWIPTLFGTGMFSLWGIVGSFVGALVGIWVVVNWTYAKSLVPRVNMRVRKLFYMKERYP